MKKLHFWGETLGLYPLKEKLKQASIAILGEENLPRTRWGFSSLKQFYPTVSPKMWRGKFYKEKAVIISNLFNHRQTPIELGWSVRKTSIQDFRGKTLTYDSHNGTDFAVPVGSRVCTAAEGKVIAILSEFNRGGLKIFIEHGDGLITTYAHLARALVTKGQVVARGEVIALSGYSGIDGFISFPWGIPHIHFNVWLNGRPIDPFSANPEDSLWRSTQPMNDSTLSHQPNYKPANFQKESVIAAIENCIDEKTKEHLYSFSSLEEQAVNTIIQMNYYPTRFQKHINLYDSYYPRTARLDIPFLDKDFDSLCFLDDLIRI